MEFFRRINKRTLLLWSLLLCLSLLCAQGVVLHVHSMDHGHDDQQSHIHAADEANDHAHMSKAHFTHDTSHNDHHDSVASEIDVSPDGLLKNSSNNIFAIALISFFFILVMFVPSQRLIHCCRESKLILHRNYVLSPPLRAPPQH